MKRISVVFALATAIVLTACAQTRQKGNQSMDKKILVAYFSATGTTAEVAKTLAEMTGADLKTAYPDVRWKEGRLLNHASKKDLETWVMDK